MKQTLRTAFVSFYLLTALVVGPSVSGAHDKSAHHGPTMKGRLSEVKGDAVVLSTDHGSITVQLSPETKISRDGTPSSREQLKVGETLELEGPALPGGEVAAREIWVHSGAHSEKEGQ